VSPQTAAARHRAWSASDTKGDAVDDLVAQLGAMGVAPLVDLRLNSISRRPGLSMTALGRALAAASYMAPSGTRRPEGEQGRFAGSSQDRRRATDCYVGLVGDPTAGEASDAAAGRVGGGPAIQTGSEPLSS
jgi:hypothetical protein